MNIRQAEETDAENLAVLIREVENTTDHMLYGPGEREFNPENKRKMIASFKAEKNSAIFLAESDKELTGFLIVKGGASIRTLHSAYIVVGILDKYRGKGIGTELFQELHKWAQSQNLHRLELTVKNDNAVGLALYKKMGFEIEGTKRHSLKINDRFIDEFYMSKLL